MFTGIVERMGTVARIDQRAPGVRLSIDAGPLAKDAAVGDSVAVNGCCLTIVTTEGVLLGFDAGPETLGRTNLGRLGRGSHVNLERSLQLNDRFGGHFVTGHVDATGRLERREDEQTWSKFWFRVPQLLQSQLASKGSVAVDGVSLTLVDVEADCFSVALIPHTLQLTTLGQLQPGAEVNIETDLLAKYVQSALLAWKDQR